MVTVEQWTGREAVLLQSVMRLSNREFARRLGVALGTVMKWRRQGVELVPMPGTQQILDATLRTVCTPDEQEAFMARLAASGVTVVPPARSPSPASEAAPVTEACPVGPFRVVSHKFLPLYAGPPLQSLWEAARPVPDGPGGLARRTLTVTHPTAGAATLYLYRCGIAMVHLEEHQHPASITDLAVWRYRTYLADRAWAGTVLRGMLGAAPDCRAIHDPGYVLSVYELGTHPWTADLLPTAVQLLATPSVLVDRRDPSNIHGLPPATEQSLFTARWKHPDAVAFTGAVSMGLAGWSGIAYHPLPAERALSTAEILDLELDVQALWAVSVHVQGLLESGHDLVMPPECGRGQLAAAYSRLTQSGPIETVQHRLMRKAILATSELPERLKSAQDALR
ncbi:XRE family transcriptional regulator [Streptomyces violascens]|uniref:XRE family transcriptional regulator n=1 Tax=Streptomyces violascens TaxID=67381 RepID=UPI0037899947